MYKFNRAFRPSLGGSNISTKVHRAGSRTVGVLAQLSINELLIASKARMELRGDRRRRTTRDTEARLTPVPGLHEFEIRSRLAGVCVSRRSRSRLASWAGCGHFRL